MANGNTVLLQHLQKKLDTLERRIDKIEKQQVLPVVRLSDKEMAELEKSRREIKAGRVLPENKLFELLQK